MADTLKTIDDQIAALEKLHGVLPDAQIKAKLAELHTTREQLAIHAQAPVPGNTLNANDITAENVVVGTQIINHNYAGANDESVALSSQAQVLYPLLNQSFDLNDLEELCFQLGIDWDNLRGDTKGSKARALLRYCDNRGLVPRLQSLMRLARPNLRDQLT